MDDGSVYSCGKNNLGQLDTGTMTSSNTPKRVVKGAYPGTTYLGDNASNPIRAIAAAKEFSLAVSNAGVVYSWGENANGQLGDSTVTQRSSPIAVHKGAYAGRSEERRVGRGSGSRRSSERRR